MGSVFLLLLLALSFRGSDAELWSNVQCNRTRVGEACLVTNACWNAYRVELFHENIDAPGASEDGILPVPTRGCYGDSCPYLPFVHIFNDTWKTFDRDAMSRTTFIDHTLYMLTYVKPGQAGFPHVIVDLILPLFETMLRVDGRVNMSSQILLLGPKQDLWGGSVVRELFGVLATAPVKHLEDFVSPTTRLCFSRAVLGGYTEVGLDRIPNPQSSDYKHRVKMVHRFRDHVLDALDIPQIPKPQIATVLLLSRPWPRAILNEGELVEALRAAKIEVELFDPSKMRFREQIIAVRKHSIMMGLTGAGLMLAMFMHTPAAMVTLFPYGTHPYRSNAECWLGVDYMALHLLAHTRFNATGDIELFGDWIPWENNYFENTFAYWQQPQQLESQYYNGLNAWPAVLKDCLSLWSFHQNQDTVIRTSELVPMVTAAAQRWRKRAKLA